MEFNEKLIRNYILWLRPDALVIKFYPRTFDPDSVSLVDPTPNWTVFEVKLADGSVKFVKFIAEDWDRGDIFKYFGEDNLIIKSLDRLNGPSITQTSLTPAPQLNS